MYMDRAKRIRLSRRWRIMIIIAAALTVLCVVSVSYTHLTLPTILLV